MGGTMEAYEALAACNRAMRKALELPAPRAKRRAAKVVERLEELEHTQPFSFTTIEQHRRWHRTLLGYLEQARAIVERLDRHIASREAVA